MTTQLSFDLPVRPALGRDDFFISPSNQIAMSRIDSWQHWSNQKMVISGPQGAGKTHLAHVWAGQSGAKIIGAMQLHQDAVAPLSQGPVAVEDVHLIAGVEAQQTALFHLHNLCLEAGQSILFTGRKEPHHWNLTLPDLDSRLRGTDLVHLSAPDDTLLKAILIKLFSDRQLSPPPELITYVIRRIDRSFAAAQTLVLELDALSLAERRPLSRGLAARLLGSVQDDMI
ncbi:MAG: DnaA/Hda family protein [Paracoccaceae bacterium]|nr:DnaA/Hda family protein [Paracoccaceae bacterium]